jgi:hypothetical protein
MMKMRVNKIIIFQINFSLCIKRLISTKILTHCEPDYRWNLCSSQCRLQPCKNTAVTTGSFSSQQVSCSLRGRNSSFYKFCPVLTRLFFISTSSIIIIAWQHKDTKGVQIVALDPSYRPVPSVVWYSIKIHSFWGLCFDKSVHVPFQSDLFTEVDLLLRFSISRISLFPYVQQVDAYVFFCVLILPLPFLQDTLLWGTSYAICD